MTEHDDAVDAVITDALQKIGEFGVTVIAVMPSPTSVRFAYTVGLTALGEPELMLVGDIPPVAASITLNELARRVLDDGVRFHPGDVPPDVLEDGYQVMICGPVPASMLPDGYPPGVAKNIYGPDAVSVYQVVYQDPDYLYPWQEGYWMPSQIYLNGGRGGSH